MGMRSVDRDALRSPTQSSIDGLLRRSMCHLSSVRVKVAVRVQPGSRKPGVGGRYGTDDPPVLVVRVAAPALEGKANEEARRVLADAFGVPPREVVLVRGSKSRSKTFDISGASSTRLKELLDLRQGTPS